MAERIGFIGLGGMGANMVRRLVSCGHEVLAYDVEPARSEQLAREGATGTANLRELVDAATIVCTSLPDPPTVRDVYQGPAGVIALADAGTATIDFSTVDPLTTQENGRQGQAAGVDVYDCPVSGGPKEAAAGDLVVFVGGDAERLERIRPVLDCLGRLVHYVGPSGSGSTVKMVNNVIANGTVLLTAEAFVLGMKCGIDADRLFEVLMTAGARSHHFEKRFPQALAGEFEPGYRLELARKDMALALDLGKALKMPLSVTACMHELFTAGVALGLEDEDYVSIIKYFEQLAGTQARSSPGESDG